MSKGGHVPLRTCIGCRVKRKKEEMIWLVQSPEGVVVVDKKKPHQGRGFYLCPDLGCLTLAKKKRKGVGYLGEIAFRFPSQKGFLIEEVRNDKE